MKIGDTFVDSSSKKEESNSINSADQNILDKVKAFDEKKDLTPEEKRQAEIDALPEDQRKFVQDNEGIGGSLRVGAESFGNEALFGVPELAYKHFADPKDVAQHEALKHFHQTADTVGSIGGMGASLLYGGELFKGASLAGKAAEGLITAGKAAEELSLGRVIAAKALGGAVEQSVVGAPHAIGEAVFGDPKNAAENLVVAGGIGALLGPTLHGASKLIEKGGKLIEPVLSKLDEGLSKGIKTPTAEEIDNFKQADEIFKNRTSRSESNLNDLNNRIKNSSEYTDEQKKIIQEYNKGAGERSNKFNETLRGEEPKTTLTDETKKVADKVISKTIGKLIAGAGLGAIGGHALGGHGLAGAALGLGLGSSHESLAGDLITKMIPEEAMTTGLEALLKANQKAVQNINKIPEILDSLNSSSFAKAVKATPTLYSDLHSDISKNDNEYEQFKQLSDKIAQNAATLKDQDIIGNNASYFNHNPELRDNYSAAALNNLQYLQNNIPKNPNPPQMFSNNAWKPSEEQLKNFQDKVDIVQNPYVVLDKLKHGTVTKDNIDTLKACYPSIYTKIATEILNHGTDPKYNKMPYEVKSKLSLVTGMPIDESFAPKNIKSLQSNFAKNNQQQNDQSPTGRSLKALNDINNGSTEISQITLGLKSSGK